MRQAIHTADGITINMAGRSVEQRAKRNTPEPKRAPLEKRAPCLLHLIFVERVHVSFA